MSHIYDAQFRGNITEPEIKQVGQNTVQEFTLFAQNRRKDPDTGEYSEVSESEPIRVSLWNDKIDESFTKGDLVAVTASLSVEHFVRRDGTPGSALRTDFVSEVELVWSKAQAPLAGASPRRGF